LPALLLSYRFNSYRDKREIGSARVIYQNLDLWLNAAIGKYYVSDLRAGIDCYGDHFIKLIL